MAGLVGPDGVPLASPGEDAPAPEELKEIPIPPKENAELKEAFEQAKALDIALGNIGKVIIQNLAAAFEVMHHQGENEERRFKAQDRAVKATGVHKDLVRGFRLERGMIVIGKKKAN